MSKLLVAFHRMLGMVMLSAALAAATAASAQTAKPAAPQAAEKASGSLPIAVMWMQRIMRESAAGKSAAQQVGELQAKYQAEIVKGQEKIRAEQDDLARQQSVLSADQFEIKRRGYQRDASDLQQLVQERNDELDLMNKKVTAQIENALLGILKQYMPERGISILVDRQSTISYDPNIDVTNEVLQRLDKALPFVKVSEEAVPGHAAAQKKAPVAQ